MVDRDRFLEIDRQFGSLLISSPQGHSGKTVITVGLCQILKEKGLSIQTFKKGPDYIDPSWLTAATSRSCRNLDLFLFPEAKLVQSFYQSSMDADFAVIEGAMGLYDGLDSTGYGTSADIAKILSVPILLVINTTRMTDSIAAMITGYQHFDPSINIAGVFLNYVSGARHERKLKDAVEKYCKIPVVGSIPRDPDLHITERHLGLIPSRESDKTEAWIEQIGKKLEPHLDLDQILSIAKRFKRPSPPLRLGEEKEGGEDSLVKIGMIFDQAFNFYYPENLEALRRSGADLILINSLEDRLPQVDGLYIGGGFPEFFLEELERNVDLRQDISRAIEGGLPVYAECAGMMYLCQSISWQGRSHQMVGAIPSEVELGQRPQGHGYVLADVIAENPFFQLGMKIRGHEFHHSKISPLRDLRFAYRITRGHGIDGKGDGIIYKNLFASYTHLHALGNPEWSERFVSVASKRKRANSQVRAIGPKGSSDGVA